MMSCNEIRELLSPYIDNLLEEGQIDKICNHLDSCPSCNRLYHELKDMTLLLSQAEALEVPAGFEQRLKESLQEVKKEEFKKVNKGLITNKRRTWRMVSSIAAIFVVGILSYGVYNEVISPIPNSLRETGKIENTRSLYVEEDGSATLQREAKPKDAVIAAGGDKSLENEAARAEESTATTQQNHSAIKKSPDQQAKNLGPDTQSAESNSSTLPKEEHLSIASEALEPSGYNEAPSILSLPESEAVSDASVNKEAISNNQWILPGSSNSSMEMSQGMPSNTAAVQLYSQLIRDKLASYSHQIVSHYYSVKGEWIFNVFIFTDQDGNTYNEEIQITGKKGEIFFPEWEKME